MAFYRLAYCYFALFIALRGRASATSSQKEPHDPVVNQRLSILMVTGYFPGHLYPITALGEELVKRGHNVSLCATVMEGSDLLPALPHSYGINFISAGPDNLTQADYERIVRGFDNQTATASVFHLSRMISIAQWPMIKIRSKIDEIGVDQFDFVISDFSVNAVGIYYAKLKKKAMILSPLFVHMDATIPQWPSPVVTTGLSDNLTFISRVANLLADTFIRSFQGRVFWGLTSIDSAFEKVLKDIHFYGYVGINVPFIIASAFGLEYAKTRYPLT